ncbi:hypothetical protein [Wolbachia endosymbiont (group E) of Neria commutata]|uniref:hypothetical protein n=1 Tax=Wolbachia endosymbiont (group E) of Neria commutata TaxID=3066149 RepID=UPI00313305C9
MTERTYKFKKGEHPLGIFYNKSGIVEKTFALLIISDEAIIGTVHPEYIHYRESIYKGILWKEDLTGGSNPSYTYRNPHNLSVELGEDGHFVITRGSRTDGFIPSIIGRDHMLSITEYGERVFSECLTSTLEHYAPADDFTNHTCDQTSCETDKEPYSAMNSDIL